MAPLEDEAVFRSPEELPGAQVFQAQGTVSKLLYPIEMSPLKL